MKYLMSSVKLAAKAVVICTEENWYVNRENSLYTMVFFRLNFNINKRSDSLSWSLVVSDFYKSRCYIIR